MSTAPINIDVLIAKGIELGRRPTIRFPALRMFLERRADLCIKLLKLLCLRLRQTNDHVEGALFERLDVRLARVLIRLSASNGVPEMEPPHVRVSQSELAGMLGAARETVNKQLHAWQRAGLVDLRKREIIILDRTAIEMLG